MKYLNIKAAYFRNLLKSASGISQQHRTFIQAKAAYDLAKQAIDGQKYDVAILEREVELAGFVCREQLVERFDGRFQPEIDARLDAGFLPELLADRGPLGVDVARDDQAFRDGARSEGLF